MQDEISKTTKRGEATSILKIESFGTPLTIDGTTRRPALMAVGSWRRTGVRVNRAVVLQALSGLASSNNKSDYAGSERGQENLPTGSSSAAVGPKGSKTYFSN